MEAFKFSNPSEKMICGHHNNLVRATSHTRLRALVHCTSSTLIGGKGGVNPRLLHTTLEGPIEYMNAR